MQDVKRLKAAAEAARAAAAKEAAAKEAAAKEAAAKEAAAKEAAANEEAPDAAEEACLLGVLVPQSSQTYCMHIDVVYEDLGSETIRLWVLSVFLVCKHAQRLKQTLWEEKARRLGACNCPKSHEHEERSFGGFKMLWMLRVSVRLWDSSLCRTRPTRFRGSPPFGPPAGQGGPKSSGVRLGTTSTRQVCLGEGPAAFLNSFPKSQQRSCCDSCR